MLTQKQEYRKFPLPPQTPEALYKLRFWFPENEAKKFQKFLDKNPSKKRLMIAGIINACTIGKNCPSFKIEKGKIFRLRIEQYRLIGSFSNDWTFLVLEQWEKKKVRLGKTENKRLNRLCKDIDNILKNASTSSQEEYWEI